MKIENIFIVSFIVLLFLTVIFPTYIPESVGGGGSGIGGNTTNNYYNITQNISTNITNNVTMTINQTTTIINTTNSGVWIELLRIPVRAATDEVIECFLMAKSNLTTSGVQIKLNLSDVTDMNQTSVIEYMTTVTAKAICISDAATIANTCSATTSVTTLVPTHIRWSSYQTNNGFFILTFKPETASTQAIIGRGAYCVRLT